MINGSHTLLFSSNPELDSSFFRDVLTLPNVDLGEGRLIFGLPPSEVAVHPADNGSSFEMYLTCDEIETFVAEMQDRALECTPVEDRGWGLVTRVTLPGGGSLGVYEPRHAHPDYPSASPPEPITMPAPPKKKRAAKKKKAMVKPAPKARGSQAKKAAKKTKR